MKKNTKTRTSHTRIQLDLTRAESDLLERIYSARIYRNANDVESKRENQRENKGEIKEKIKERRNPRNDYGIEKREEDEYRKIKERKSGVNERGDASEKSEAAETEEQRNERLEQDRRRESRCTARAVTGFIEPSLIYSCRELNAEYFERNPKSLGRNSRAISTKQLDRHYLWDTRYI